jgi:glycosyltransferase involved in cell wall biosynthesis
MINPCAVKGLSIFLETAARLPEIEFGVVVGWGTTSDDRRALERLPNVRFLPNARNIDEVLARTRVLLMPSLWYEGFGLIVMEAMLRGIPVVASDSGGLVEAKHGTGYVIPVRTIERYEPVFDEHSMPRPVVRENDPAPWVTAVRGLLTDRSAYEHESITSRTAAHRFVSTLDAAALERHLTSLEARPDVRSAPASIESLSPEKRALLLERLRKRKAAT